MFASPHGPDRSHWIHPSLPSKFAAPVHESLNLARHCPGLVGDVARPRALTQAPGDDLLQLKIISPPQGVIKKPRPFWRQLRAQWDLWWPVPRQNYFARKISTLAWQALQLNRHADGVFGRDRVSPTVQTPRLFLSYSATPPSHRTRFQYRIG